VCHRCRQERRSCRVPMTSTLLSSVSTTVILLWGTVHALTLRNPVELNIAHVLDAGDRWRGRLRLAEAEYAEFSLEIKRVQRRFNRRLCCSTLCRTRVVGMIGCSCNGQVPCICLLHATCLQAFTHTCGAWRSKRTRSPQRCLA
jgi:hypothetical protein